MTQVTGTLKAPRKEYAPGDVIGGKYGLLRLLGEGGMGSVWVAENMALKANVALKLIRADVAESSANERFLSEARLAARLQHASIVRVFDFGKTEQDEPYIVMELLEGETLGQRLTRLGAIDPMELCQTLLPIVDALHSAHGHGVIHRDLKPDNVFIAKADGGGSQPKLLDFGIAKLRGEGPFHSTKLTQAGTLIGSPDYMSPEQARGETDLDPRSDVWALCVLAYECLVGKPPFHGDNYNALLWAIIHDEPVPITVFQAGDAELWRILKTGFAKDRNARWESARKLGEALAAWLESHGVMEDICNRSLQASWLPAERPTRPELQPFDPLAGPPTYRGSSHDSMMPAPTLASMRRPRAMSLWFAGLGLATLLGAWVLSKTDAIGIPTVEAENTGSKVGTLLPKSPSLPGPAKETLDDPAPTQPVANTEPVRAEEPIAAPQVEGNSWKQNHDPGLHRDPALAERMDKGMRGPGSAAGNSSGSSGTVAANDDRDPAPAARPATSGSSNAAAQHRPPPPKAAPKPAAKPPRATPKRSTDPNSSDNEVDFGI